MCVLCVWLLRRMMRPQRPTAAAAALLCARRGKTSKVLPFFHSPNGPNGPRTRPERTSPAPVRLPERSPNGARTLTTFPYGTRLHTPWDWLRVECGGNLATPSAWVGSDQSRIDRLSDVGLSEPGSTRPGLAEGGVWRKSGDPLSVDRLGPAGLGPLAKSEGRVFIFFSFSPTLYRSKR